MDEVPPIGSPDILMFRDGRWVEAGEPLHQDKPGAGIGLSMSFAEAVLKRMPDIRIGLIPVAVGGSALSRWLPGAELYEQAVEIARTALGNRKLDGLLWHQGENDSNHENEALTYKARFMNMVNGMKNELNMNETIVITGELGEYLPEAEGNHQYYDQINRQLNELCDEMDNYGCASSEGLVHRGDLAHFNSVSLREFGRRYAKKYLSICKSS